jgi:undecaprenyl-diphosphatase
MGIVEAVILGLIEGVTEYLPISSTGHLTIAEKLMGLNIDDKSVTAFTAIIQLGSIAAAIWFFHADIIRIVKGFLEGIVRAAARDSFEYKLGWGIIIGSIPIAVVGLLFKHQIETSLRSLWVVAIALLAWSGVMYLADRADKGRRHEKDVTWKDTLFIGVVQCLALIPGVSRSGATISAGLFRGIDRVAVTRLSFFLGIPALVAAGLLEAATSASDISNGVGWPATIAATLASFGVAYVAIAWLLRYIANHTFRAFIIYRTVLGLVLIVLLATGVLAAS